MGLGCWQAAADAVVGMDPQLAQVDGLQGSKRLHSMHSRGFPLMNERAASCCCCQLVCAVDPIQPGPRASTAHLACHC